MPQLSNKLGLPEALVRAIDSHNHDGAGADLTVTEAVGSPRVGALRRAHRGEISEDVVDRMWSLWGLTVARILADSGLGLANTLTEYRLTTTCRGWTVSGQLDTHSLTSGRLSDWKAVSWYSFKDGAKAEWVAQTNLYALLVTEAGHEVRELEIVPLVRDHRASEAKRYANEGYPPEPVTRLPVELWPLEQTRAYLDDRVRLHQLARQSLQAGSLPHCTREERWQRKETWAVMKDGNVRASKLCLTQSEALATIGDAPGFRVDYRPGIAVRCGKYCSVRPWCEQLSDGQFSPGDLEVSDDA